MNQEKIGKFISLKRHEKKLTQDELAHRLNVSKNAVSKWERGICLMDMSLLKPLSEILNVEIIDVLSGEKVSSDKLIEKHEEVLDDLININKIKEKSFALYGFMIMYTLLIIYKEIYKNNNIDDYLSIILMTISFKFFSKYKLSKSHLGLVMSIIAFIASVYFLISYITINL